MPKATAADAPPAAPEAERRQLTVMFCDLVGSTALAEQLDPEDLREVNRAYQDACKAAIERYDGYVARYMGDGVLAYFGHPRAHEDDAERAIHAGLGVIDSVSGLHFDSEDPKLAVRVGIDTGPVVVGDLIGEGASQENAVVGKTPSVAARLQALAAQNTLVIGPGTHDLAGERFAYEALGSHSLKGIAEPVDAWRVIGPAAVESRFEVRRRAGLTPLVGRQHEIGLLLVRWSQAKEGEGQIVQLSGEAGIGKSRITEALRERTATDDPVTLRYQCSPFYTNTALHPVIEQIQRAARIEADAPNETKLHKLEALLGRGPVGAEELIPLVAPLLSISVEGRYAPPDLTPERQKELTLEALTARVEALSRHQPVLILFEDLHWADPTSLELLALTVERAPRIPVLLVLTYRPEFSPPWGEHPHVTSLTLNRFTRSLAAAMAQNVAGAKPLPDEVIGQIIEGTDGVPLFVEEVTKTILESGALAEETDRYVSTGPLGDSIPATLHDSLMARLDRLGTVKEVAQTAAVIGRELDYDLLDAVSPLGSEELLEALNRLVEAGLAFRRGRSEEGAYVFKHALVQDAAYGSLLKRKRRTIHGRIARTLRDRFPERAERQPEILAHHFSEADETAEAVGYWLIAGRRAAERSANREAVRHLETGLAMIQALPASRERAREELGLQIALYTPLVAVKGYNAAEIPRMCARIRALSELTGETEELLQALYGQLVHHAVSGQYLAAQATAEELLELARAARDLPSMLQAHRTLGWITLLLGSLPRASSHLERAVALYDPRTGRSLALRYGHSPHVAALSALAAYRWLVGFPARAHHTGEQALEHARELGHVASLCYGLNFRALRAAMTRDPCAALESSSACMRLASEHNIVSFLDSNQIVSGWANARIGRREQGSGMLREGMERLARSGEHIFQTLYLALHAEACLDNGDLSAAKSTLDRALQLVEATGERWYEAELNRLLGELYLAQGQHSRAEAAIEAAMDRARRLGERTLELRSASSLARLWRNEGKEGEARALLTPLYEWFTEGFDTPDLKEAEALLNQFS